MNNKPTSPKASTDGRGGDGLLVQSPQQSETDPELSVDPQLRAFKTICENIELQPPSVTIDQVKCFVVAFGKGCIVARTDTRWSYTLCGSVVVGGEILKTQPKRVCSKCREALKTAKPIN